MKFVSLRRKGAHRQCRSDKASRATPESVTKPVSEPHQIHSYTELRQQIHHDLRIQHPEWVQPNGDCPMCDAYEARLMKLLDTVGRKRSHEWVVALHRALEQALN